MSPSSENGNQLPEFPAGLNFEETKLTLGLPGGESRAAKSGSKRGFSETIDFSLGNSSSSAGDRDCKKMVDDESSEVKSPAIEAQVIGWPPIRASRKIATKSAGAGCKYVKVAVDGAPYLRKVDLEMYNSYQQLLNSLEGMFSFLTIRNYLSERTIMDHLNGMEYVPTYEDKDGDWMLVGDVPWNMFVESCKRLRLRLVKSSETIGLAPSTPSQSSSTCTR